MSETFFLKLHLQFRCFIFVCAMGMSPEVFSQWEQQFVHVVKEAETLASIAQRYYGDPKKEQVLVSENGLTELGGSAIVVGMRLAIPFVYFHRLRQNETWQSLAQKYYGNRRKAFLLINENKGSIKEQPHVGGELLIPYPLRHVASQTETITKLSITYFGNKKNVSAIRRFNGQRSSRLNRGQIVLIPLNNLILSPQGKQIVEESLQRKFSSGEILSLQKDIDIQLPKLRAFVRQGNYLQGVALGNYLLGARNLTGNQSVIIQQELAIAFTAMGSKELAVQAFVEALSFQPFLELDLVRTSPKVFDIFQEAKKQYLLQSQPTKIEEDDESGNIH